jgi:nitrite reductase/ring-hydroxylating ferredoxin subunit
MVTFASTDEVAHTRRFHRATGGTDMHLTNFLGGDARAPGPGAPQTHPSGPMAYLVDQAPNSVVGTHFHRIDQWQVVIDGEGLLGSHHVTPVSLHFAAAYSPYGPIKAGEKGLSYFTLRPGYDRGAHYMPDARDDLRSNRTSAHREVFAQLNSGSRHDDLIKLSRPRQEVLVKPEADGLAAWRFLLPPSGTIEGPDPRLSGGQTWLVLKGGLMAEGQLLPPRSCLFVTSSDDAIGLVAGSAGVEMLCVQYPLTLDAKHEPSTKIRTERWMRAAAKADIPSSNMLGVELADHAVVIFRLSDDEFCATDGICTHQDAYLADGWLDDGIVVCPLHAGCFDVRSGKGQGEPITRDLATYPVRINNGDIEVDISQLLAKE